jgi:glycosyltransferase involved in cell wall biosynthesis
MSNRAGEPVVSVVMPVFNTERYVGAAVESVLGQSFGDFEFIIIDDGSTDASKEVLEGCARKDERIRLVRRPNTGYAVALNEALGMTRGEFVARMDSDDVSRPGRFAAQVGFLRSHPDVVVVGGQAMAMDPDGEEMYRWEGCHRDHEVIEALHLKGQGGVILHPAAMIRREALLRVGGYRVEFEPAEDVDLFLRLGEVGRLANVEDVVLDYRLRSRSVTYTRMVQQVRLARRAADEARVRRGMEPLGEEEGLEPEVLGEGEIFRNWARRTYRRGNYRLARKYALRAVRREFTSMASWRMLLGAWLGPSGRPLHRLYRRVKGLSPVEG